MDKTLLAVIVVIVIAKLPSAQQLALKTMGISSTSIDITNAMVACAKADLSNNRIDAIKGGATTSASEAINLVSCYNAN